MVLDNLVYGHAEAVKWGPLEQGDLADRPWLDAMFARHQPAAVIHFAAFAYVGESMSDPGKYYRNNVAAALELIEAATAHGVSALVFSSTCATYGIPQNVPIAESEPQVPINPYGRSKLMVEAILEDFERSHGLRSVALRYFNAAGADPDGELGECHEPETHLIPLALDAAAGTGPTISVLWHRLSHARRHLRARLHPRHRSGRCPCPVAGPLAGRRRLRPDQPRHGAGSERERDHGGDRAGHRQGGAAWLWTTA